jgi:hypothetical protein
MPAHKAVSLPPLAAAASSVARSDWIPRLPFKDRNSPCALCQRLRLRERGGYAGRRPPVYSSKAQAPHHEFRNLVTADQTMQESKTIEEKSRKGPEPNVTHGK